MAKISAGWPALHYKRIRHWVRAPQTELEIHQIVEKARRRRRHSEKSKVDQANGGRLMRANASLDGQEANAQPAAAKEPEQRPVAGEDGIAEVPKRASVSRTRSQGVRVTG